MKRCKGTSVQARRWASPFHGLRGLAVAAVLAAAWLTATAAHPLAAVLPGTAPGASAPAPAPATPQERAAELASARAQATRLQQLADAQVPTPLLEEQRNLTARLVLLLSLHDQLDPAAGARRQEALAPPPLGEPPYPASEVDALRDHRDALQAQAKSLSLTVRALDAQVVSLLAVRRKAEEDLRLHQDQLSRARQPEAQERLRAQAEVSRLEARIAELELSRAERTRAASREQEALLSQTAEQVNRDVERVWRLQRIDDESLAQVAAAADAARKALKTQRRSLEQRLAARETVAASSRPEAASAAREVKALQGQIEAVIELDQIEAGREEVWRQRRLALTAAGDPTSSQEALAMLGRSIEQLSARGQAMADRLDLVRAALRAQRLQAQAQPEADNILAERRALEALQQESDALENLRERLLRMRLLLQRSLEDLQARMAVEPVPLATRLLDAVIGTAAAVWRYELFSVSESTEVDGRTVTLDYGVTVGKSVGVVALFLIGALVASWVSRALIGVLVRRLQLSPQLGAVLHRWTVSLLLLGVLIVVLKLARIPMTAFAFLGGALAIGVGFGTQTIIKNLISGVIILFERKVRVGDVVTIDGVSGTVSAVDLRATTVRGFDGIEAIVPNSQLLENRVSNWSYGSPTIRRSVTVGLRYGDDALQAESVILACAAADADILDQPAPEVLFDDFGPDAQILRLQYWMRLGGARSGAAIDSELRHAISKAFKAHGLVIARPQRLVQLDTQGPLHVQIESRR